MIEEKTIDIDIENYREICWIPIKVRKPTKEDIEAYSRDFDEIEWVYDCRLPDDGEEVLITTGYGNIVITTFYRDDEYGCYFDSYEDADDVKAWAHLPEPYKEGENT